MAIKVRLRCAFQQKDADPKNQVVINPCFDVAGASPDLNLLCSDLATALDSFMITGANGGQLTVKSYDLEGTKPVYPNGTSGVRNPGVYKQPMGDPTQAVCLSFYGTNNVPRRRGRLYIPSWWTSTSAALLANYKVDATIMTKVGTLAGVLSALGGVNVNWIVWSPTGNASYQVTNWFVNDRWDHVRSRGLKETARQVGTSSG